MIRAEGTDPMGTPKRAPCPLLSPYPGQQRDTVWGWQRWKRCWIRGLQSPNASGTRSSFPTRPVFPSIFARARFKLRIQRDIKITPRPPTWEIDSFTSHPAPALNIPIYMQIVLPPCTAPGAEPVGGSVTVLGPHLAPPPHLQAGPGGPSGVLMLLPELGGDTKWWQCRPTRVLPLREPILGLIPNSTPLIPFLWWALAAPPSPARGAADAARDGEVGGGMRKTWASRGCALLL